MSVPLLERIQGVLGRAYRRWTWSGSERACPFCQSSLRAFVPHGRSEEVLQTLEVVGSGVRPEGRCPVCGGWDRERLVRLWFEKNRDALPESVPLLHVAPEPGLRRYLKTLPGVSPWNVDLEAPGMDEWMDITQIPKPDHSYQAIVCNHVLEHIPEDRQAMAELFRVLRPGGFAILQVPFSRKLETTRENPSIRAPEERRQAFGQEDHVRIYQLDDYLSRLAEAGFGLEVFDWTQDPSDRVRGELWGIDPRECLVVVRRPS